jgi:hypothetical protein
VLVLPRYHLEETPQARTGSGRPGSIPLPGLFTKKQKKLRGLFLLLTGYEASSINTTLEATVHSWSLYMAQYGTRRWSMLKNATQVTSGPW